MKRTLIGILWGLLILSFLAACGGRESDSSGTTAAETAAAAGAETTYRMVGRIVSRDSSKNTVNIDNEPIPQMAAMKMDYEVRATKVDALPPDGTKVEMMVHEKDGTYYLTEIKPVP